LLAGNGQGRQQESVEEIKDFSSAAPCETETKLKADILLRWIFATLYGTERFITALTRAQLSSVSSAI